MTFCISPLIRLGALDPGHLQVSWSESHSMWLDLSLAYELARLSDHVDRARRQGRREPQKGQQNQRSSTRGREHASVHELDGQQMLTWSTGGFSLDPAEAVAFRLGVLKAMRERSAAEIRAQITTDLLGAAAISEVLPVSSDLDERLRHQLQRNLWTGERTESTSWHASALQRGANVYWMLRGQMYAQPHAWLFELDAQALSSGRAVPDPHPSLVHVWNVRSGLWIGGCRRARVERTAGLLDVSPLPAADELISLLADAQPRALARSAAQQLSGRSAGPTAYWDWSEA